MTENIPLFPLSVVVFPGEQLRLHIFEPRYQELIADCEANGWWFGIPPVIGEEMRSVATMVEILSVDERFPGGESNITVQGQERIRIEQFFPRSPQKLYPAGNGVTLSEELQKGDWGRLSDLRQEILDLIFQLHDALGIHKQEPVVKTPEDISAFNIGHEVGLDLRQEAELLAMDNESGRLNFLYDHLKNVLPIVREAQRLKARSQLNGHYKNLVPPNF